jgi:PAS domain S-box-containing protein
MNRAESLAIELRRANQHTIDTLEHIAECYFRLDLECRFLEVNRIAEETIFKRPASDLLGKNYEEEYPQVIDSEFQMQCRLAVAEMHEARFEAQIEPTGKWFECYVFPDCSGGFAIPPVSDHLDVYLRDIHDRKQAQEALRKSEHKYRLLIETMDEGFATVDEDYVFTYINLRFTQMLRYSQDEILGHGILEFLDKANWALMQDQMTQWRKGAYGHYELSWVAKDGQAVHTIISPRPIVDDDGRFIGSFATVTEITDRKRFEDALRESEHKYRELFHNANDAIFVLEVMEDGLDGHFMDINEIACRRLGYSREQLLNMGPKDIDDPEASKNRPAIVQDILQNGSSTFEMVQLSRSGARIPVEISSHLFTLEGKRVILSIARDITERIRAEEERRAFEMHIEEQKRFFYKETILSVTDGKLDICEEGDLALYLMNAELTADVSSAAQLSLARCEVEEFCHTHGLDGDRLGLFITAIGEAMTNAVKHGANGRVYAGVKEDCIWVAIQDEGPGIGSLILPRAVLLRGFSTKPSLGLGYCVMLDAADQIHLKTDKNGTTVILEKRITEQDAALSLQNFPDTWSNIPG